MSMYQRFGLNITATEEEVKNQFQSPSARGKRGFAHALDTLTHPVKRSVYDQNILLTGMPLPVGFPYREESAIATDYKSVYDLDHMDYNARVLRLANMKQVLEERGNRTNLSALYWVLIAFGFLSFVIINITHGWNPMNLLVVPEVIIGALLVKSAMEQRTIKFVLPFGLLSGVLITYIAPATLLTPLIWVGLGLLLRARSRKSQEVMTGLFTRAPEPHQYLLNHNDQKSSVFINMNPIFPFLVPMDGSRTVNMYRIGNKRKDGTQLSIPVFKGKNNDFIFLTAKTELEADSFEALKLFFQGLRNIYENINMTYNQKRRVRVIYILNEGAHEFTSPWNRIDWFRSASRSIEVAQAYAKKHDFGLGFAEKMVVAPDVEKALEYAFLGGGYVHRLP